MTGRLQPVVVLDRDGVLNESIPTANGSRPPRDVQEFKLVVGAPKMVEDLAAQGFTIVVATNQPDVARKTADMADVDQINALIKSEIPQIERFYVCSHDNADACECRKPAPGMILRALREFAGDPRTSWMVGDRWPDIAAGQAAGVRTLLVESPKSLDSTSVGGPPTDLRIDMSVSAVTEIASAIQAMAETYRSPTD